MAPNLLDLATNHKVVKTQTEASIAELLLASTPSDHFKISNHETTSHRYEHYSHEISDVEELSDIRSNLRSCSPMTTRHP
jgi:hypothetical protein